MSKKWIAAAAAAILLFSAFPAPPYEAEAAPQEKAKILNDTLNIRKGPGLSYGIEAVARKNESYGVLERTKDWVKLDLPGNRTGWAASWLVQVQSPEKKEYVYATTDDVRIRSGAGTNYRITGSLPEGRQAVLLERKGSWTKVSYDGATGWVASQFIAGRSTGGTKAPEAPKGTNGYITAASLNVRSAPASASSIIGSVKKGTAVVILQTNGSWHRISYSGKTGWVSSDFVSSKAASGTTKPKSGQVTANSLNVRSTPALSGSIAGKVSKNQKVEIIDERDSWLKIRFSGSRTGWVSALYIKSVSEGSTDRVDGGTSGSIRLLSSGTNIRTKPTVSSQVLMRGAAGQTFTVIGIQNDWYQISLPNGRTGFVAGWLAEDSKLGQAIKKPAAANSLKGKTIVIDPGHGGMDGGTSGHGGTLEKNLTMRTAGLLAEGLQSQGANPILTRSSDYYITLGSRVSTSHLKKADAFISVHYDSNPVRTVRGMTVYYYHSSGKLLAQPVKEELIRSTRSKDRGVQFGNYKVLRDNSRPSILLELGFLSNTADEMTVNSNGFQNSAANGITNGLKKYFSQ
ncbi:SH3 domain-containing protein [Metabacillus mangrovi]|nr:SH3 domain-containing protein [Metabacillus mangrovi]